MYREYETADPFAERVGAFLSANEALNSLMLGIIERLKANPPRSGVRPYFGVVEEDDALALVGLMTPPHRLLLQSACAACPREALRLMAGALEKGNWPVAGVLARDDLAHGFANAWCGPAGARAETGMRQRVHELRRVNDVAIPPGAFRPAAPEDLDPAVRWAHAFHRECFGEGGVTPVPSAGDVREMIDSNRLFFWCNAAGRPVSMAARLRPTARGESISWVYTPPEERRRGYASAVVARLTALLLAGGKTFVSLYTDLANPTSNKIYRRIGFLPVADVAEINFKPA